MNSYPMTATDLVESQIDPQTWSIINSEVEILQSRGATIPEIAKHIVLVSYLLFLDH